MARLSLQESLQIMDNAGLIQYTSDFSRYAFTHFPTPETKELVVRFDTGREVVKFVTECGKTVEGVVAWVDSHVEKKQTYINVITGETYVCTENDLEAMFS